MQPRIAIISQNTLTAIGLASLIEKMMPTGDVCIYESLSHLAKETRAGYNAADDPFVHYFISAQVLMEHARFFLPRRHKTIVLIQGAETSSLPEGFLQIDICQPRETLLHQIMTLHGKAHGPHGLHPHDMASIAHHAMSNKAPNTHRHKLPDDKALTLTRRETEVLRHLVRGLSNKEVADALGVGLTTIITHRNNLTSKLGTRSLAALTVYAVSHGIVGLEEISR